jgi:HK97 family phage major capsid protein
MILGELKQFSGEKLKALGSSIGEDGGFLIPEEFRAEIVRKAVKASVIRPNAMIMEPVAKKGVLPKETGTVSVAWESENFSSSESTNPKFGSIPWSLNKLKGMTKISRELVKHSGIDILELLSTMFGEQIAIEQDKQNMTGSGSGRPLGIRNATGVSSTAQAGANLAYEDLVKTKHKLPVQYRRGASWLIHNDILSLIARILDTQGRPIFLDLSNLGGQGTNATIPDQTVGMLLGLPVLEQADIPTNLGGGGNESEVWLGDLKRYGIFDEGIMEMATTEEGAGTFEADQVAVKVVRYEDGKVLNADAFTKLTGVK